MKKVDFQKICNEMNNTFQLSLNIDELTPDAIFESLKSYDESIEFKKIEKWDFFETGKLDFTIEQFLPDLFIEKNINVDEDIFLITDECFKEKMAFQIKFKNIGSFASNEYFKIFNISFVQPSDIIIYKPDDKIIFLIHHSGYSFLYRV